MIEVSGRAQKCLSVCIHECQMANKPRANMKMICQNGMPSEKEEEIRESHMCEFSRLSLDIMIALLKLGVIPKIGRDYYSAFRNISDCIAIGNLPAEKMHKMRSNHFGDIWLEIFTHSTSDRSVEFFHDLKIYICTHTHTFTMCRRVCRSHV